ncbi:hypothetical protein VOLCADRAFT_92096 [Volvox carteri f. nagariensis]|uniref:Endonuclease/exonuclease/phosphatase domain-containing protein n=1 Tax=Volvox carteri f. nagariensis TaxID=3068 RepID=D8TYK8_VOLCA|nr:uncharacterized protein VOLCADRAFT_92096 [Volvox carteri f. nagariensis]EFJ47328.1 hypothetical protein VOLCADRAFT_92096 [Volvox carteri f. nagariensis]|eukprot:XP_002951517.1 hypothetical protein VOLCADRAFT_92096 [Volvox carteri f. nagariensis]
MNGPEDLPLKVPCLPWLPRPKCCFRPPSATLVLATWNLENFSVAAANSTANGEVPKKLWILFQVTNIYKTLRELCSMEEHRTASVVVALQEISCPKSVPFLARYMTEMDSREGGSGRVWHCLTSRASARLAAWKAIGADARTLHVLKHGVPVEFRGNRPPPAFDLPSFPATDEQSRWWLEKEEPRLVALGAISRWFMAFGRQLEEDERSAESFQVPLWILFQVRNIRETLQELCSQEEHRMASVVVALQEISTSTAVPFLARYMTEMDSREGGSGRVWHCLTSRPVGNNLEKSAFLWSRSPHEAPLHSGQVPSFQLLSEEDLQRVIRPPENQQMQQQQGQGQPGGGGGGGGVSGNIAFRRSPFFGLFRVGYANVLLVNVHLAAKETEARSELEALHLVATAIREPNSHLFHRHCLGGLFRSRKPRGLLAVLGDFNCPMRMSGAAGPASGQVNENSWQRFLRNGWFDALITGNNPLSDNLHGGAAPRPTLHTNWHAQELRAFDAICLPLTHAGLVQERGVCRPPEPQPQTSDYPNHLLCWVRLDLGPLQEAPGKLRPLVTPRLQLAGEGGVAAAAGGGG